MPTQTQFETTTGAQAKVNAALATAVTRRGLVQSARNVLDETFDITTIGQSAAITASPATGELVAGLVGLVAGDLAKGLAFHFAKASLTLTLFKAVLYDTSGNLLASSADQSAAFNSGGTGVVKNVAFSSVYTVPTTGAYYAGVVATFSAGSYSMMCGAKTSVLATLIDSGKSIIASQAGQTDAPNPATLAAGSATNAGFWFAVYK